MHAHFKSLVAAPFIGSLLAAMLLTPFAASAATPKPSCTLTVTTSAGDTKITTTSSKKTEITVNSGDTLSVSWNSTNVKSTTLNGDDVSTSGMATSTATEATEYAFVGINGSKKVRCTAEVTVVVPASIDRGSLTDGSNKPSLTGSAGDYKTLYIEITKKDDDRILLDKKVTVSHGQWKYRVTKKLADGAYTVRLTDKNGDTTIASGTLYIGVAPVSNAKLSVSILPLLAGGVAHANTSVPVMYLQVRNTGTAAATLTGFNVQQSGSAPANVITGLSTVDDKGLDRTASTGVSFVNGIGLAPSTSVIAPGQTKLYTIKADIAASAGASAGQTLQLNLTSVAIGASLISAPITGVTWVIAQ